LLVKKIAGSGRRVIENKVNSKSVKKLVKTNSNKIQSNSKKQIQNDKKTNSKAK
jgi:hypothetical protein